MIMFAITQTEYYLTILKYCALTTGVAAIAVLFITVAWLAVFYSHYWR